MVAAGADWATGLGVEAEVEVAATVGFEGVGVAADREYPLDWLADAFEGVGAFDTDEAGLGADTVGFEVDGFEAEAVGFEDDDDERLYSPLAEGRLELELEGFDDDGFDDEGFDDELGLLAPIPNTHRAINSPVMMTFFI